MSEYHTAKHVFGELTFGEYWNLLGCHAFCVTVNGRNCVDFQPYQMFEQTCVRFKLSYYNLEEVFVDVPLSSKIKVDAHKVRAKNYLGEDVLLEFYKLSPLEDLS